MVITFNDFEKQAKDFLDKQVKEIEELIDKEIVEKHAAINSGTGIRIYLSNFDVEAIKIIKNRYSAGGWDVAFENNYISIRKPLFPAKKYSETNYKD